MKIPCKDCITLAICKAKSKDYESDDCYIHPIIFKRCIRNHITWKNQELLLVVRWFLRPDLKFTAPHHCEDLNLITSSRQVYYENTM